MIERQDVGPIEFHYEGPPDVFIDVMHTVGVVRPRDVCWRNTMPGSKHCSCGGVLKPMRFTFSFLKGDDRNLAIAQCERCLTVYWLEIL